MQERLVKPFHMHPPVRLLKTCMTALGEPDHATVGSLFAPGSKVMDLFTFDRVSSKVTHLDLLCDTHPIRASAGNKYQL